jgi:hypothetical protein
MIRVTFLKVRFAPIALLALAATGDVAARGSLASNVVLVHGAWADGSRHRWGPRSRRARSLLNTCRLAMLDVPFQVVQIIAAATRGE